MNTVRINANADPTFATAMRVTEFWRTVGIGLEDECWPWFGYVNKDGYGEFFFNGRMVGAHELALSFATGEKRLPGFDTCHSCHNPACCNPSHLRFDTRQGNVRDMVEAGRQHRPDFKLDRQTADVIRLRIAAGAMQKQLAREYGVSEGYITMIKQGKRHA